MLPLIPGLFGRQIVSFPSVEIFLVFLFFRDWLLLAAVSLGAVFGQGFCQKRTYRRESKRSRNARNFLVLVWKCVKFVWRCNFNSSVISFLGNQGQKVCMLCMEKVSLKREKCFYFRRWHINHLPAGRLRIAKCKTMLEKREREREREKKKSFEI